MRRPRVLAVAAVVAAALIAVVAFLALSNRGETGMAAAIGVLEDADAFDSSAEAADAFAHVASLLLDDGRRCRDREGDDPRCDGRLAGAAYAQVLAVPALRCTSPGIFEAQQALLRYLREVERLEGTATQAPALPGVPRCD